MSKNRDEYYDNFKKHVNAVFTDRNERIVILQILHQLKNIEEQTERVFEYAKGVREVNKASYANLSLKLEHLPLALKDSGIGIDTSLYESIDL